jgi:hypothetical protein
MPKINIRSEHITQPAPDVVVLNNPVLRQLLVQKQGAALDWLTNRVKPVDISKVSIDDHGRVVISDPDFAQLLSARVAAEAGNAIAGDTACSNGAC